MVSVCWTDVQNCKTQSRGFQEYFEHLPCNCKLFSVLLNGWIAQQCNVLTDKSLTKVSPRSQCRLWLCPHDRYRSVVTPAPSSPSVAAVRSSIKIGSQYLLVARTSPMEDTRKTGGWSWSAPSAPHRHRTDRAYYRHLMFEYFMHEQKFTFLHRAVFYALHKTQRHKNQFAVKQFKIDTKIVVLSHNNQSTENEIFSLIDSVQCTLLVSICLQV